MSDHAPEAHSSEYTERFLPALVFRLGRELRTAIDHELSSHGITTQQAVLMLVSRFHRGHGLGHLADPLGTDTAGMTRLIDRLEAKGLVVRAASPTDRRAVTIELTPAGEALAPELIAAFRRAQERLLAGIGESDLEQFRATLKRLRENLHAAAGRER
jgi:DNA-binding MarR family transcriptional regulator